MIWWNLKIISKYVCIKVDSICCFQPNSEKVTVHTFQKKKKYKEASMKKCIPYGLHIHFDLCTPLLLIISITCTIKMIKMRIIRVQEPLFWWANWIYLGIVIVRQLEKIFCDYISIVWSPKSRTRGHGYSIFIFSYLYSNTI